MEMEQIKYNNDTTRVLGSIGDSITWSAHILELETSSKIIRILIDMWSIQSWDLGIKYKAFTDYLTDEIDYILLTHWHVDHIWNLPILLRYGQEDVPIYCTDIVKKHTQIALEDVLRIQKNMDYKKELQNKRETRVIKLNSLIEYLETQGIFTLTEYLEESFDEINSIPTKGTMKKRNNKDNNKRKGWNLSIKDEAKKMRNLCNRMVNQSHDFKGCKDINELKAYRDSLKEKIEKLDVVELQRFSNNDLQVIMKNVNWLDFQEVKKLWEELTIVFHDSGHILWSAMIEINNNFSNKKYLISWDLWSYNTKNRFHWEPSTVEWPFDAIIMESTLWNKIRTSSIEVALNKISNIINDTKGPILMPVISYGRLQEMICYIDRLKENWNIHKDIKIYCSWFTAQEYLDKIFKPRAITLGMPELKDEKKYEWFSYDVLDKASSIEQFEKAIYLFTPGMLDTEASSGKLFSHMLNNEDSSIIMTNYQAKWIGRQLQENIEQWDESYEIIVNENTVIVKCKYYYFDCFSWHGDQLDLMKFAKQHPSKQYFLVHGSDQARDELKNTLEWDGLNVINPQLWEKYYL